jgi:hypothetical protein
LHEKVLSVHVSEGIYTNISFLVQKFVDDEPFNLFGIQENNNRPLSPEMRAFIEEMTVDVVNAMK